MVRHNLTGGREEKSNNNSLSGFFGRLNLEHALNTLAKLLEDKICALFTQLAYLQPNTSFNSSVSSNLSIIYEDIHWLLLIAGESQNSISSHFCELLNVYNFSK